MGIALAIAVLVAPLPLACWCCGRFRDDSLASPWVRFSWILCSFFLLIQQTVPLLLGIFGALRLWPVAGAYAAVLAVGVYLLRKSPSPWPAQALRPSLWWSTLFGLPVALLAAMVITRQSTSYDTLMYHYPMVANWLQGGSLARITHGFYVACFPGGYELWLAPLMLMAGNDSLCLLANIPIALHLALGLFLLCRELGSSESAAKCAAALTLSVALVPVTLRGAHVDVAVAGFTAGALYTAATYSRTRSVGEIALFCCNAGLLCSVKMSGPGYVGVAGLFAAWLLAENLWRREPVWPTAAPMRTLSGLSVLSALALVGLGGFWYFRNWAEFGNPLGFIELRLGPLHFPKAGPMEGSVADVGRGSLARVFEPGNREHWEIIAGQLWERFGAPLPVLLLAAVMGLVLRRNSMMSFARQLALLCFSAVGVYLYMRSPFTADNGSHQWQLTPWMGYQMRYGFPALLFVAPLATMGLMRMPVVIQNLTTVFAVLWGCLFCLVGTESKFSFGTAFGARGGGGLGAWATEIQLMAVVWITCVLVAAIWVGFVLLRRNLPTKLSISLAGIVAVLALAVTAAGACPRFDATRRAVAGNINGAINALVPPGAKVAYLDSHRATFFWRDGYDNTVRYLPATSDDPSAWATALDEFGADYIAMGPPVSKGKTPREFTWLTEGSLRQHYQLVHGKAPYANAVLFARVR